jgi:hypothetical protein
MVQDWMNFATETAFPKMRFRKHNIQHRNEFCNRNRIPTKWNL